MEAFNPLLPAPPEPSNDWTRPLGLAVERLVRFLKGMQRDGSAFAFGGDVHGPLLDSGGGVFNIRNRSYGAAGDGVTSDTAALQAVWAACKAAGGGVIWFPAGTYLIDGSPTLSSGDGITLEGARGAIITQTKLVYPLFSALPTFYNCTNVTIRGISFDTNGNPAFGGLRFWNCTGVTLGDCHIYDSHITAPNGKDRVALQFYYNTGFAAPTPYFCQDVTINNCTFEDLQVDTYACKNLKFTGNTVRRGNVTGGLVMIVKGVDSTSVEDVLVDGNLFEDCQGASIYMPIEDAPAPTYSRQSCTYRNIRITNNTFVFNSTTGTRAVYFGIANNTWATLGCKVHGLAVEGNRVYVPQSSGSLTMTEIFFGNNSATSAIDFQQIVIEGNTIYGNGTGTGIDLRRVDNSAVVDNAIYNTATGTSIGVISGCLVEGNQAWSVVTDHAISFASSTGRNVVRGNLAAGVPVTRYSLVGAPAAADVYETEIISFPTANAVGDVLFATSASAWGLLPDVAAGKYLRSGGVTTAPLWSTLSLPNAATTGDLFYATGTNAMGVLGIGAVNRVATSTGSAPQWVANIAYAALPTGSGSWDVGAGSQLTLTRLLRSTGNVGIGADPDAFSGLRVNPGSGLSGTGQYGVLADPIFQSGATVSGRAVLGRIRTVASVFTMTGASAFYVQNASMGAGWIITTQYGLNIEALSGAGTNIAINTGNNPCVFGGAVTIGGDLTLTAPTTAAAASAGANTLPANPVGFLVVSIAGTSRKIPYFAT